MYFFLSYRKYPYLPKKIHYFARLFKRKIAFRYIALVDVMCFCVSCKRSLTLSKYFFVLVQFTNLNLAQRKKNNNILFTKENKNNRKTKIFINIVARTTEKKLQESNPISIIYTYLILETNECVFFPLFLVTLVTSDTISRLECFIICCAFLCNELNKSVL